MNYRDTAYLNTHTVKNTHTSNLMGKVEMQNTQIIQTLEEIDSGSV